MRANFLPFPSLASTFHKSFVLLAGVLVYLSPLVLSAQSVTFAGAQSVLPTIGLGDTGFGSVAVDNAGDVFIADDSHSRVVELPRTATGYGAQTTLPTNGLDGDIAVDGAGDLFVTSYFVDEDGVAEFPRTATGYGPEAVLFTYNWGVGALALDGAGDIFFATGFYSPVDELPRTPTGYGPQTSLLPQNTGVFAFYGIAVDNAEDIFAADFGNNRVVEFPRTTTGYGPLTTLPAVGLNLPYAVAVDGFGDVFIVDSFNNRVVELPWTGAGYGPQTTLAAGNLDEPLSAVSDSAGDVFIADSYRGRVVEVQARSVNFGNANICMAGQPAPCSQTLTLNFNVNAGVTLGTPKVLTGGTPNLDFTLASGSTCTGAVTEGTTCTVNVTFTPLTTGVRNGAVEITDDSGDVLATTPIYGNTAPPTMALFSANPLDFGTVAFGGTSTLPLTITNIGLTSFTLTPSINGQSYTITGSTCGASLAPNSSCTLQVEFSPVIVGTHHDRLTLATNGTSDPSVSLHGIASGVGSAIRVLNFGTVKAYTTAVLPLTITNFGVPGTVTIGTAINGNSFAILETSANTCLAGIASGQSCVLPVEFLANSVGTHNEQLTLTPSGGAASVVHLDAVEAAP